MSRKSWHASKLGTRSLAPETLMMGYGGAERVANFLADRPNVASVWYLGFLPKAHPDREVFERQCRGPGSTFSFEVKGGEAEAFSVLNRLKVIKLAVSLGGTETLASHPSTMTHCDITRVLGKQQIWQSHSSSNQGVTVLGGYEYNTPEVSLFEHFVSFGLLDVGLLPWRPDEQAGFEIRMDVSVHC